MIRRTPLRNRAGVGRSAALHYVATEDAYGGRYFEVLERRGITDPARVKVVPIQTPEGGRPDPDEVVARLAEFQATLTRVEDFDGFWALIDVDHHFSGGHQRHVASAVQRARAIGATVLVSNPCFEVWLLLHVADRPAAFGASSELRGSLAAAVAGGGKDALDALGLTRARVERALQTARVVPEDGIVPENPGSAVWKLVERLL